MTDVNHRVGAAPGSLSHEELLGIYRTMVLSRAIDDQEIKLKRKNQYFFQISGAGHEAILIAAGKVLRPAHDWFYPYYRDRALMLELGMTPREMFLCGVGSVEDPNSGARQMPSHWGHKALNVVSQSSPTGTQCLQAVGCAEAGRYFELMAEIADRERLFRDDEVVYVSIGDGGTAEGEFWEALATACVDKLPVFFLVEDNGYAISVPVEVQTPGGSISAVVRDYPGLKHLEVDGNDIMAALDACREGVAHCRARRGPALVHAHVTRPYSHSMSDDQGAYRAQAEITAEAEQDCIRRLERTLIGQELATAADLERIRKEVAAEVLAAADAALKAPRPPSGSGTLYVYSPDVDPTSAEFATEPGTSTELISIVEAVNRCLRDEMARDPRILVFGEDCADATRSEILDEVPGKGGVFKVTHKLQRQFGPERVFNSPLAEANIVGRAIGMATRGLKPVPEIQFFDYIWPAMMQIRNELAMMRWRSNNAFSCPLVIRVPIGGYLGGGAVYHSQSGEVIFTHSPGLRVVMPSNALDANGLLRTAIRCDDPVLFLEHKHLYRQPHAKAPYPGPNYMVPFGKAKRVREGRDLTIVTYGALVRRSLLAADRAASDQGIEAEVLDLRSLAPWDQAAVGESVKKTGKALVVYEDTISFGYGAEVAAWIADQVFEWLDAPVKRVASLDTPVAYAPNIEDEILPQTEDVLAALRELAEY